MVIDLKDYIKHDDHNDDNDDHNNDYDDEHNDDDQNCHNLVNFQARGSRFCMV